MFKNGASLILRALMKDDAVMGNERLTPTSNGVAGMGDLGGRVLEKIRGLNLAPVPQIYELWFNYFQGNPEVTRAIDAYQGQIDEVFCHGLHKRYLSEKAREDTVKNISDQVQQAIAELATMLNSVELATSEYGDTLEDVSTKIENAVALADLGSVVSNIVQDTKMMMQKNQALEIQL